MFINPQYIPGLQAIARVELWFSILCDPCSNILCSAVALVRQVARHSESAQANLGRSLIMSTVDAFAVATYGLRLDRCSTCLPKSSVLPFGSVSVAQKTMAQLLSVLKISQLLPDATEMPLSTVRLTLAAPISSEKMTAADVRRAMEDKGLLPPGVNVVLFFKDDEGDFVTLPSSEVVWPSCCIFKDVLKAWFVEAPATPPSSTVCASLGPHAHQPPKKSPCACFGPHVHQPPKKKLLTLDVNDFQGYSLLAAAEDGCVSCVEYWLGNGVDPNLRAAAVTTRPWTSLCGQRRNLTSARRLPSR